MMDWLMRSIRFATPSSGFLIAAALVALAASHTAVWFKGRESAMEKYNDLIAKQATQAVAIVTKQGAVTERVVVKFRERIKRVEVRGETIVERIPYIVPDGQYRLSIGFVRIHDAAAEGTIPEPAAGTDAAASSVTEVAAARVVARNYTICHADQERLSGLQEWVREQAALAR